MDSLNTLPLMANQTVKPLRVKQAAALLGVDPDTLRRWADTGRINFIKTPTGERRFRPEDLAPYVTSRKVT